MIALEQVRQYLETLPQAKSWTTPWTPRPTGSCPIRRCAELLGVEVAARRERYLTTRICAYLQQFDRLPGRAAGQGVQPGSHQRPPAGSARRGQDPPGHALALRAIRPRRLLRPRLRPDGRPQKARAEHNLDRRMKVYLAPKVLVVDEFGIWPYDRESATAFFTLVSARYERASSSRRTRASANGANPPTAGGESYRLREKRQAGLFPSQHRAAPEEAGDNYARIAEQNVGDAQ